MRCATIHGGMGFEDLDAAEDRRQARLKRRIPKQDFVTAKPAPPVHPRSRLIDSEEKPGMQFEPTPAPAEIISPPSGGKRRARRDWEPEEDVIPTMAISQKDLPLPDEIPTPEFEEDIPDADAPKEEGAPKTELRNQEVVEKALAPEPPPVKVAPPVRQHPKHGRKPSPPEEQLLGMPRLNLAQIDVREAPPSALGIAIAIGVLTAIGVAIYYLKK